MKTETPYNAPLKTCKTCEFQDGRKCTRGGYLCDTIRATAWLPNSQCNENFSGWRPKPPSIGLVRRFWRWIF